MTAEEMLRDEIDRHNETRTKLEAAEAQVAELKHGQTGRRTYTKESACTS